MTWSELVEEAQAERDRYKQERDELLGAIRGHADDCEYVGWPVDDFDLTHPDRNLYDLAQRVEGGEHG